MPRALQVAGLTTFSVGLAGVAAATCLLSYAGIHAIAQQGGIQAHYAKGYPLLLDALLAIALAAVLALRGAGLPSRVLSWLTLLVLLVAVAGAEALHATGRRLPRDAAAITVTVLPWLVVLATFVLLLAMLRHARLRGPTSSARTVLAPADTDVPGWDPHQQTSPPPAPIPVRTPQPWHSAPILPSLSARLVSAAAAGAAAGAAAAEEEARGVGGGSATPAHPGPPDESSLALGPNASAGGEPAGSRPADIGKENGNGDRAGEAEPPSPPAG
jgi:hypothetical protein